MCTQRKERPKSKKRKRRTKSDTLQAMLDTLDHPVCIVSSTYITLPHHSPTTKCLDVDAMRGVEMKDLKAHFGKMSPEDREKLDFNGVFLAKHPNGLAQLYIRDPNGGGGADIHPSVREFWHTVIVKGQPHDIIHEEDMNNILVMYAYYRSFYASEPGFVRRRDDFFEQSFKLKKAGKPMLQKLGIKHFKVAAHLVV